MLFRWVNAVMLSESAVGIDPANAVDIMCQTIIETENAIHITNLMILMI